MHLDRRTLASYHPHPKEVLAGDPWATKPKVLQRFENHQSSGGDPPKWSSCRYNKSLKRILEKPRFKAPAFISLCFHRYYKHLNTGSWPDSWPAFSWWREYSGGQRVWVGRHGLKSCLNCPLIFPLEYSFHYEGTLWFKSNAWREKKKGCFCFVFF